MLVVDVCPWAVTDNDDTGAREEPPMSQNEVSQALTKINMGPSLSSIA